MENEDCQIEDVIDSFSDTSLGTKEELITMYGENNQLCSTEEFINIHFEDLLEIKADTDNENIIEQNSSFIIKDIGFAKNENDIQSNNIAIDEILFDNNKKTFHTVDVDNEIKTEEIFLDPSSSQLDSVKEEITTHLNNKNNNQSIYTKDDPIVNEYNNMQLENLLEIKADNDNIIEENFTFIKEDCFDKNENDIQSNNIAIDDILFDNNEKTYHTVDIDNEIKPDEINVFLQLNSSPLDLVQQEFTTNLNNNNNNQLFPIKDVFNVNEYNNIQLEDLLEIKADIDNENIIEQNSSFIIKDMGFAKNKNDIQSNNNNLNSSPLDLVQQEFTTNLNNNNNNQLFPIKDVFNVNEYNNIQLEDLLEIKADMDNEKIIEQNSSFIIKDMGFAKNKNDIQSNNNNLNSSPLDLVLQEFTTNLNNNNNNQLFPIKDVFNDNEYNNMRLECLLEIIADMDNENKIEQNSSSIIKDNSFAKNDNNIQSNNIAMDEILFDNNEKICHTIGVDNDMKTEEICLDPSSSQLGSVKEEIATNLCNKNKNQSLYTKEETNFGLKFIANETCKLSSSQQSHLQKHIIVSSTNIRHYECDICLKLFSKKQYLNNHMIVHNDYKPHKCDTCGKCFKRKIQLQKHVTIHTNNKSHECGVCKKSFSQRGYLNNHLLTHTMYDGPYRCNTCNISYAQNRDFMRHMVSHTNEEHYVCTICNKIFINKKCFKKHINIHTGNKPYQCEVCKKLYTRKSDLTRHTRNIHTDNKPFKCKFCDRTFSRNDGLNIHIIIHTNNKCIYCENYFSLKEDLMRHLNTVHSLCGESITQ